MRKTAMAAALVLAKLFLIELMAFFIVWQ